jgi:hypothetical protein
MMLMLLQDLVLITTINGILKKYLDLKNKSLKKYFIVLSKGSAIVWNFRKLLISKIKCRTKYKRKMLKIFALRLYLNLQDSPNHSLNYPLHQVTMILVKLFSMILFAVSSKVQIQQHLLAMSHAYLTKKLYNNLLVLGFITLILFLKN